MKCSRLIALFALLALAGCASMARRVTVRSVPQGAEIYSATGEPLGSTPLTFSAQLLAKASSDGSLRIKLKAPGYAEREISLEIAGDDVHTIRLTKLDDETFRDYMLGDFRSQSNEMIRELLQVQGLVLVGQLNEAQRRLEVFQKSFPNIAAGYAILAGIELKRGNRQLAHGYLLRARSLDPHDAAVERLLDATSP